MTFEAASDRFGRGQRRLDGRVIGRGTRIEWAVWPGRHALELLDARRKPLDRITFEVRGAEVRSTLANRSATRWQSVARPAW